MHENKKNTLSTPQISPENLAKPATKLKDFKKRSVATFFALRNARINILQPTHRRVP